MLWGEAAGDIALRTQWLGTEEGVLVPLVCPICSCLLASLMF